VKDWEDLLKMLLPAVLGVVVIFLLPTSSSSSSSPSELSCSCGRIQYYQNHPDTVARSSASKRQSFQNLSARFKRSFQPSSNSPTPYGMTSRTLLVCFLHSTWPRMSFSFLIYSIRRGFTEPPISPPENATHLDVARHLDYISALATKLSNQNCVSEAREAIGDALRNFA